MPRIKKLTDYSYSPTNPASEDAIRLQIDDAIQEVYDASAKNTDTVNLTGAQTVGGIKTLTDGIKVPVASAVDNPIRKDTFETHKTSSDHDGRYYTETEVNALLLANQQGNHEGTWQGYNPTAIDPMIQNIVDQHEKKLNDIVVSIGDYAVGDQSDETIAIQQALNESVGKILYWKKQTSGYFKTGQLTIPSNTTIIFEPGTIVQAIDTLSQTPTYQRMFVMPDKENIIIYGNNAIFRMNKASYSGEQNHIFDISGAKNVIIEKAICKDSGGDGFYIGNYQSVNTYCENITIKDCISDNNRRQGMSVISVDGLIVENCKFKNTIGTSPESGVNIEPNTNTDKLKNIFFKNCKSINNAGNGFEVVNTSFDATSEFANIKFDNCYTFGNVYGFANKYFKDDSKGEIKLDNCFAENAKLCGFMELSCSSIGIKKIYNECIALNCNTENATSNTISFASSFYTFDISTQPRTSIGNTEYIKCKSFDTRGVSLIRRGFATSNPNAAAIDNVVFKDCESTGDNVSKFEIDSDGTNMFVRNMIKNELSYTTSTLILVRYSDYILNNTGSTGNVTTTLPVAKKGTRFNFLVTTAQNFKITPQSGSVIRIYTTSGQSIQSSTIGTQITLEAQSDGNWIPSNVVGTWTVV